MTSTDDREALAAHLSVEEFEDGFTWPEHADDDGYRGGGYVQIAPSDIQALRREAADRILTLLQQRGFARTSSPTPDGVIKERGEGGRRPDGHGLSHSGSSPSVSTAAAASIPGARRLRIMSASEMPRDATTCLVIDGSDDSAILWQWDGDHGHVIEQQKIHRLESWMREASICVVMDDLVAFLRQCARDQRAEREDAQEHL